MTCCASCDGPKLQRPAYVGFGGFLDTIVNAVSTGANVATDVARIKAATGGGGSKTPTVVYQPSVSAPSILDSFGAQNRPWVIGGGLVLGALVLKSVMK